LIVVLVRKTLLLLRRERNGQKVTPYNHLKLVETQLSHYTHQKGGQKIHGFVVVLGT
jgi:hypothetical protein